MLHYIVILALLIYSCWTDEDGPRGQFPPLSSPNSAPPRFVPPNLHSNRVKAKLEKLFDEELDQNKDNYVSIEEIQDWLKSAYQESMNASWEALWKRFQPESLRKLEGSQLTWDQYRKLTYPESLFETESAEEVASIKITLKRLERRWNKADSNGDKTLTKDEFKTFLYPEESEKTSGVLVDEVMEDVDKNKNGKISLEEYMEHSKNIAGEEKNDDNWASNQKGHFVNILDKNKDGSLDKDEFKEWILPPYDKHQMEAWKLITAVFMENRTSSATLERGAAITKQDVINHHEFFLPKKPFEYWTDGQSKHDEF